MGQHLHLYAAKPSMATLAEAKAWCDCRCDELFRTPTTGFEDGAFKLVSATMSSLRDTTQHYESGSTWAVSVWPRLWWHAYVITPELVDQCIHDAEYFMLWNPNLPYTGERWINGPEIQFLRRNIGLVCWGDNDGI